MFENEESDRNFWDSLDDKTIQNINNAMEG
jgi:hypothetical protein